LSCASGEEDCGAAIAVVLKKIREARTPSRSFHWSPPLPHARELKAVPSFEWMQAETGLRTSPVSWLGGGAASSLPALREVVIRAQNSGNLRIPLYSRAAATAGSKQAAV
jgi:hypothetical protein